MDKEILNKLKYLINKKKTIDEICEILGVSYQELLAALEYLKVLGNDYCIKENHIYKMPSFYALRLPPKYGCNEINICFVSDLHYGSIFDRPDVMQEVYDECLEREIDSIFCAGDFTDGYYPKREGYSKRQKIKGYDAMMEYVINVHPYSNRINFYTIAGNHDKTFMNIDHKNFLEELAKKRDDIFFLGVNCAEVLIDKIHLHLNHGYYNCSGSLEERANQFYENLGAGRIPDIIELGHLHHSLFTSLNSTYIFQTAALTDQMSKEYDLERSCWFVNIKYDEFGNIIQITPELKVFKDEPVRKIIL